MKTTEKLSPALQSFVRGEAPDPGQEEELRLLRREYTKRPVIYVGTGTCGLGAGAGETLDAARQWLEENGREADLVRVGCAGLCASEPLVDIQIPGFKRVAFEKVTAGNAGNILDAVFQLEIPEDHLLGQYGDTAGKEWENVPGIGKHPFFEPQCRLVLKNCGRLDPASIEEYIASGGYRAFAGILNSRTPEEVVEDMIRSGLRGRGGGGFPTGMKWKLAASETGDRKYLICNADEGDPGAFMDRAVIEGDPYRLLEGMSIAAYAIGATEAYIYIRAEYPLAIERLHVAIEQAYRFGFLGKGILGRPVNLDIRTKKGAGAFVCGEETALIRSIEGKRGMPAARPPFPTSRGLFGKPTCINNVETLANVPGIFEWGPERFASIGTEKSKGTKVFALSGNVRRTGLVEIPMGTSLREIIYDIAGGVPGGKQLKAVQIGGPSGGCLREEDLGIRVDYESLVRAGAMMGSGGMVVMDENTCMVDVARFFMDFIQRESCGKCIPCREGTRRMLEILNSITRKPDAGRKNAALERFKGVMQLEKLARVIRDTSLCGLGKSAPNPVLSTLKLFREEYEEHIFNRNCPAGVCTGLRTFAIDADKCTGCTACARNCPAGAIVGTRKSPHFIVEDKCTGCGACQDLCRFDAIQVKEATRVK